ncbi:MAG: ABC transporter permease, partial [Lachnospiraceae bacterium]|nr:ABC transporter permease [Lachnospiraceae bacterium]
RNKVIAGYSRKDTYLSQLIVVSAASLLMLLAGMAGGLVGIPVFGFWKMGAGQLFLYLLIAAMSTLVFCAVNTYINVLTQNKVRSAVLTILVFFALLFLVSKLQARLDEPDTVFSDIQIHGDEINFLEPMPNPRYVSGAKREILDFIVDVLPTGQGLRLASNEAAHPVRMLLSSAVLTVLVTFGGIFRYGREDLK